MKIELKLTKETDYEGKVKYWIQLLENGEHKNWIESFNDLGEAKEAYREKLIRIQQPTTEVLQSDIINTKKIENESSN